MYRDIVVRVVFCFSIIEDGFRIFKFCGEEIKEGKRFCNECGWKIN